MKLAGSLCKTTSKGHYQKYQIYKETPAGQQFGSFEAGFPLQVSDVFFSCHQFISSMSKPRAGLIADSSRNHGDF